MKKLTVALMLALSCALLSGVQAQKNAPTKMGGTKTPGKMDAAKGSKQSISGIVKGAANGKMFTVGQKKGPVQVDGTGVQPRNKTGQFAKWDDIKGGTMVTVVGMMNGSTLKADKITVNFVAGGTKKPAAMGAKAGGAAMAGTPAAKPEAKKGMMAKMKDKMGAMKDKMKAKMGGAKPDEKKP